MVQMHLLPAPPTLTMHTTNYSEMSVHIYRNTQCYIPKQNFVVIYYENHKSHACVVSSQFEICSDLHSSTMKFGMQEPHLCICIQQD